MEPSLVLAVLFSALLHALWNSFVKVGQDRLASVAVMCATGAVLSVPVALLLPLPGTAGFGFALLSVTTHLAYYFCLLNAYRFGDLSRVYPMARGLAPPLVAIGAALIAGERLSAREIFGVALVSFGIASLVAGARGDPRAARRLVRRRHRRDDRHLHDHRRARRPFGAARAELHRLAQHAGRRGAAGRGALSAAARRSGPPCAPRSRAACWPA